jgi:hypothetical protein
VETSLDDEVAALLAKRKAVAERPAAQGGTCSSGRSTT